MMYFDDNLCKADSSDNVYFNKQKNHVPHGDSLDWFWKWINIFSLNWVET